jgi:transposase
LLSHLLAPISDTNPKKHHAFMLAHRPFPLKSADATRRDGSHAHRQGTAVKILLYDGQGYWLCQKRLSTGRFLHWPSGNSPVCTLQSHQLQVLLAGGNAEAASGAPVWRPVLLPT